VGHIVHKHQVGVLMELWGADCSRMAYNNVEPADVVELLEELRQRKEASYARSWAKRGVLGFWSGGISRQVDRIDPGFKRLVGFSNTDDPKFAPVLMSVLGTLGDIINYALMGICLLAAMFPEEYDAWVVKIDNED